MKIASFEANENEISMAFPSLKVTDDVRSMDKKNEIVKILITHFFVCLDWISGRDKATHFGNRFIL